MNFSFETLKNSFGNSPIKDMKDKTYRIGVELYMLDKQAQKEVFAFMARRLGTKKKHKPKLDLS